MNATFERLSAILVETFKLPPERLTPGATLAALNIDSLGMVELLWQVEEAFNITLPKRAPALHTLGDVVGFIDRLVATSGASPSADPSPTAGTAAGLPANTSAAPQRPAASVLRPR